MLWGDLDGTWHGRTVVVTDPRPLAWFTTTRDEHPWQPTIGTLIQAAQDAVPVLSDAHDVMHSFPSWATVELLDVMPCPNRVPGWYHCSRRILHRGSCDIVLEDSSEESAD